MREIKFRVWDKKEKEMYDVLTLNRYYKDKPMTITWIGNLFNFPVPPTAQKGISEEEENNYILMQYTGLKDENGKEIYEGDIVIKRFENPKGTKWEKKIVVEIPDFYGEWFCGGIDDEYEIIGNIYQNPELLKNYNKE